MKRIIRKSFIIFLFCFLFTSGVSAANPVEIKLPSITKEESINLYKQYIKPYRQEQSSLAFRFDYTSTKDSNYHLTAKGLKMAQDTLDYLRLSHGLQRAELTDELNEVAQKGIDFLDAHPELGVGHYVASGIDNEADEALSSSNLEAARASSSLGLIGFYLDDVNAISNSVGHRTSLLWPESATMGIATGYEAAALYTGFKGQRIENTYTVVAFPAAGANPVDIVADRGSNFGIRDKLLWSIHLPNDTSLGKNVELSVQQNDEKPIIFSKGYSTDILADERPLCEYQEGGSTIIFNPAIFTKYNYNNLKGNTYTITLKGIEGATTDEISYKASFYSLYDEKAYDFKVNSIYIKDVASIYRKDGIYNFETEIDPPNLKNELKFTWSIDRPDLADLKGNINGSSFNFQLKCKGPGTVTVTGVCGDIKVTKTIEISDLSVYDVPLESISFSHAPIQAFLGETKNAFSILLNPRNTTERDVAIRVSDPTIAKVEVDGTITGLKAGTTKCTAYSVKNPNISDTVEITILDRNNLPGSGGSSSGNNQGSNSGTGSGTPSDSPGGSGATGGTGMPGGTGTGGGTGLPGGTGTGGGSVSDDNSEGESQKPGTGTSPGENTPETQEYTIKINSVSSSIGTVTGSGKYKSGTEVTLKAVPADGYEFTGWTENGKTVSTSATYKFKVTSDRTLEAVFSKKNTETTYVDIYRLYNNKSGEHLYTSDSNEKNVLSAQADWDYEGVSWTSPTSGTGVYRLYSPVTGFHLYTTDTNEVNTLESVGWQVDNSRKPLYYSGGSVPIYRLYNEGLRQHLLTRDINEYNTLPNHGWRQEGQKINASN